MTNEQVLANLIGMIVNDLYLCNVLNKTNLDKYTKILEPLRAKLEREKSDE